ncbi:MAG: hypothetical protein HY800_08050 [Ignavibacteriales bacterium]|nr:hypothetical protein [Ignavibacteriales bacterium]
MKKPIPTSHESIQDKPIYCTECGDKLEDFCFSEDAKNLEVIRKHHEVCKKVKRFKGDQCSRLFIAEPTEPIGPTDVEDQ